MSALLQGWTRELRAFGHRWRSPDGRGTITVRDRVRPALPARVLVDELCDELGGRLVAWKRLLTDEGEHAMLATVAGQDGEATLGLVLGDDFIARVDGHGAGLAPLVEAMVVELSLGLGSLRRRRFEYARPAGWTGRARGLTTEWMPPGFPRDLSLITVFPARSPHASRELDGPPAGAEWLIEEPIALVGLEGAILESVGPADEHGRRASVDRAELTDGRYLYILQLETELGGRAAALPVFRALVDSARPIPLPIVCDRAGLLDHWAA